MIKKKIALTISIVLFVVAYSYSQEEINLYEINQQLLIKKNELNYSKPFSESVLIQQIGDNNSNYVLSNFNSGSITIRQDGNNNDSNVVRLGDNVIENVYQKGDNNLFYDYSALPTNNANININQFGNDLSIYNSGTNSISNSLSITQKGSNQMLIILNN